MKNEKTEKIQVTAIVPSTETTTKLLPAPTARLVEKSFAENTVRNQRHAFEKFSERRFISILVHGVTPIIKEWLIFETTDCHKKRTKLKMTRWSIVTITENLTL